MTSFEKASRDATAPQESSGTEGLQTHVEDEISPLEAVIVHKPGLEMERLTPPNHKKLLFDDLLSPAAAKKEHESFTTLMESRGVQVLELTDLLTTTLENPEAREFVIQNTFNWKRLGPLMSPRIQEWLQGLNASELCELCLQGITNEEWSKISREPSLVAQSLGPDDFLVGPLPNHMFTRDASVWAYGGVAISSMSREARRRESLHYSAIYKYHPAFANSDFEIWTEGRAGASRSVEGGDILVLGNGLLAVGLSERTTPQGVEHLAMELFEAGKADRVMAVMLPKSREFMHLDTVMTQLDTDKFSLYPPTRDLDAVLLEKSGDGVKIRQLEGGTAKGLQDVMGYPLTFVAPQATSAELSREQWNDGFNMLALEPGVVVAYDRTPRSNDAMREAGLEVLEIEGSELGRGRGGPRCMSAPVKRQAKP